MKTSRRIVVATAAVAAFASGAGIAFAAWSTTNGGSGTSQAVTVTAPGVPTANGSPTSTAIPIQWTAGSVGGASVSYWVQRADFNGTTYSDACSSTQAAPISATNCTDSGLASAHDYQYKVTVIAGNWQKTGSVSDKFSTTAEATLSPSALSTPVTGSTPRAAERNDTIQITFSSAIDPSTICSGWDGTTLLKGGNGSSSFNVNISSANPNVVTFTGTCDGVNTPHIGSISLGSNAYNPSGAAKTYGGNVSNNNNGSISLNGAKTVLTITLGAGTTSSQAPASPSFVATYTPDAGIKNAAGTATVSGTINSTGPLF